MECFKCPKGALLCSAITVLISISGHSEAEGSNSAADINRELSNPNTSLASLTFRNQYRWYDGDLPDADNQENYTLVFQPVFPFVFGEDENDVIHKLFVRPAIPIHIDQPTFDTEDGSFEGESGLGDIGFDVAYGLSYPNGFQVAGGMVGTLPTATGDIAGGTAAAGPEIFVGQASQSFGFVGALITHQWDLGSWSDNDVSNTAFQAIIVKVLPNAWAVGSVPIMTYNWKTDEASIPVNVFVQKTVTLFGTPTRLQIEANYFVTDANEFSPEWFVAFNITPVVDNFLQP